ncbi:MAG: response regulator transcription factor [Clostridia bacterium]|nr:response regulator transcription factor [Clostridia bacterium]
MIRVALVDDEQEIFSSYRTLFERFAKEEGWNEEFKLTFFSDGLELVESYKQGYDLILMDIDMKKLNGLETARALRKMDENVLLIFVTRFSQYAINGYQYEAFDFVLKPLDYATFKLKMKRIVKVLSRNSGRTIFLRSEGGNVVLSCKTITYIEVIKHELIYHTTDKTYRVYGTLVDAKKELADSHFILCHRSYLVNAAYVSKIQGMDIIVNGEKLPISRNYKREVTEYMANFFAGDV